MTHDEVSRIRDRFERLVTAGTAIHSRHELNQVLQEVVDAARDVVGAKYAALGVVGEDRTSLVQFVTSGIDEEARRQIGDLPRGRGLLGHVIAEAKPIRTVDISRHPKRYGFPEHHPPMKSFLGVPVQGRGGVFGNLYLTEKIGAAEFDAEDEAIAIQLASQAAVAIDNARLAGEREQLIGKIQALQRQRDLFFAMMNHELRNALTGVYGWAERLVRKKSPEAVAQAGREVFDAAERTIALLNNFLDLTRLDSGKVQPQWRTVEIAAVADRAMTGARPTAEAKNVVVEARWPPAPTTLRTDPLLLQQILVNLLSNAIRHSPAGGMVTMVGSAANGWYTLSVTDQGSGIPAGMHEKIFEPFERFDPNSGVGTGLGLPVSRRLAEVLRGSLAVESSAGHGATFALKLPVAAAE